MHQSGKAGDEAKKRKSPSAPKAGELASGKFSFTLFFVRATKTLLREQKKKKKKKKRKEKNTSTPSGRLPPHVESAYGAKGNYFNE